MPRFLVCLRSGVDAWVLEWTTNCDAPVTTGTHVRDLQVTTERIERALWNGTSSRAYMKSGEATVLFNHAGVGETVLTVEQIIDAYCRRSIPRPVGFDAAAATEEALNAELAARKKALRDVGLLEPPRLRARDLPMGEFTSYTTEDRLGRERGFAIT